MGDKSRTKPQLLKEIELLKLRIADLEKSQVMYTKPETALQGSEYWVRNKNHTFIPMEINTSVLRTATGEPKALISVVRDITENKRTENLLRASEERFRSLVETTSDWIWEVDEKGAYTYVSPKVKDILGYEPSELMGKTPLDIMPPAEAERVSQIIVQYFRDQKPLMMFENLNIHKDGRVIVLETSGVPVVDDDGHLAGYRGIDRDITERKKVDEALKKSQELLHVITENMSDMIRVTDLQGKNVYVSPSHFKGLGYTAEDRLGKSGLDIVYPEDIDEMINIFAEGMTSKQPVRAEYRVWHADGRCVWLETVADFFRAGQGEATALVLSSRDITERKRMEEALLESEIKFKSFAEQALVGIYLLQDGVFKYVNPKFALMFGYTVEECLQSMPFEKLVCKEDLAGVRESVRQRIQGEVEFVHYTFRGIKKDGRVFYVEIHGSSSIHNGRPAAAGALLDITESKRIQEALRDSENHFRRLAENATDVIWIINMDMKLTYVSPSISKLLGFTPEEAMTRTVRQIYTPASFDKSMRILAEEMKIEKSGHGDPNRSRMLELELICKDGNITPIEGNYCFLRDHTGRAVNILANVRDIKERKRAEEERLRIEKLQSILQMAGTICHEMNQPMQIISGYSEMLLTNILENDPIREKLDAINQQIGRMGSITKKLMKIKDFETQDYAGFTRIIDIGRNTGDEGQ